jgi:hypothetical protein
VQHRVEGCDEANERRTEAVSTERAYLDILNALEEGKLSAETAVRLFKAASAKAKAKAASEESAALRAYAEQMAMQNHPHLLTMHRSNKKREARLRMSNDDHIKNSVYKAKNRMMTVRSCMLLPILLDTDPARRDRVCRIAAGIELDCDDLTERILEHNRQIIFPLMDNGFLNLHGDLVVDSPLPFFPTYIPRVCST